MVWLSLLQLPHPSGPRRSNVWVLAEKIREEQPKVQRSIIILPNSTWACSTFLGWTFIFSQKPCEQCSKPSVVPLSPYRLRGESGSVENWFPHGLWYSSIYTGYSATPFYVVNLRHHQWYSHICWIVFNDFLHDKTILNPQIIQTISYSDDYPLVNQHSYGKSQSLLGKSTKSMDHVQSVKEYQEDYCFHTMLQHSYVILLPISRRKIYGINVNHVTLR